MLHKIKPYSQKYFDAWLDLVADFSIELQEEYLVWNCRPELPKGSFSYVLLNDHDQLIASLDIAPVKNKNSFEVKHWSCRQENLEQSFLNFLKEIVKFHRAPIRMWVASPLLHEILDPFAKCLRERVQFFLNSSFITSPKKELGFCDHVYAEADLEKWDKIQKSFHVVNKNFLLPKFQKYLEINFSFA